MWDFQNIALLSVQTSLTTTFAQSTCFKTFAFPFGGAEFIHFNLPTWFWLKLNGEVHFNCHQKSLYCLCFLWLPWFPHYQAVNAALLSLCVLKCSHGCSGQMWCPVTDRDRIAWHVLFHISPLAPPFPLCSLGKFGKNTARTVLTWTTTHLSHWLSSDASWCCCSCKLQTGETKGTGITLAIEYCTWLLYKND